MGKKRGIPPALPQRYLGAKAPRTSYSFVARERMDLVDVQSRRRVKSGPTLLELARLARKRDPENAHEQRFHPDHTDTIPTPDLVVEAEGIAEPVTRRIFVTDPSGIIRINDGDNDVQISDTDPGELTIEAEGDVTVACGSEEIVVHAPEIVGIAEELMQGRSGEVLKQLWDEGCVKLLGFHGVDVTESCERIQLEVHKRLLVIDRRRAQLFDALAQGCGSKQELLVHAAEALRSLDSRPTSSPRNEA